MFKPFNSLKLPPTSSPASFDKLRMTEPGEENPPEFFEERWGLERSVAVKRFERIEPFIFYRGGNFFGPAIILNSSMASASRGISRIAFS